MPHPLPADLGLDDLHPALLANDPAMFHPFVFPTIALIIFGGPKDLGAEESILLRFKGPVVDRLRFLHLSVRPGFDLFWRGNGDADGIIADRILHLFIER
jgi:hypothetical protein